MSRGAMSRHENANTGTDTWLTPRHIIDALGTFDLDPCAAPDPERWPTARTHYTYRDDGLTHDWTGRVWLNPPYSQAWQWVHRLAEHGEGTALVFARTETAGFALHVWQRASAILFLHGRLTFHHADGSRAVGNAGAPSCLVAYGIEDALALAASGIPGSLVTTWRYRGGDIDGHPTLWT